MFLGRRVLTKLRLNIMAITKNGEALLITLLFRLLFGGYVVGMDQYSFNDFGSASTVLLIYVLIGVFASLYLSGKRFGIKCLIGLEIAFLALNSLFTVISLGQLTDAGLHNPLNNWWQTFLRFFFSIVTLVFSVKVYRESN
jgi:hypothetical protein